MHWVIQTGTSGEPKRARSSAGHLYIDWATIYVGTTMRRPSDAPPPGRGAAGPRQAAASPAAGRRAGATAGVPARDATVPEAGYRELVRDLPKRVRVLPRLEAGWGRFELVEAELSGYRAALKETAAQHLIMMSGADYPLVSSSTLVEELSRSAGSRWPRSTRFRSVTGALGGYDRFWFRQWPWRRRRLVLPVPRRVPAELDPAGGSQMKILSRDDAELVLSIRDGRPDLMTFFRRCWIPDEVVIPTILNSPRLVDRPVRVLRPSRRVINWGSDQGQSPHWLTVADLPQLREARSRSEAAALFARKFHDDSEQIIQLIDSKLRTASRHVAR